MTRADLKKLETLLQKWDDKLDHREDVYWDRSDKWQESDKGLEYDDRTNEMRAVRDTLEMAMDELEALLDS